MRFHDNFLDHFFIYQGFEKTVTGEKIKRQILQGSGGGSETRGDWMEAGERQEVRTKSMGGLMTSKGFASEDFLC